MRIIENGFSLMSVPVAPSLPSVNEPHDLEHVLNHLKDNPDQHVLFDYVTKQFCI